MFVLVPRDDNFQALTTTSDHSIIGPFASIKEAFDFWKKKIAYRSDVKYMVKALTVPKN